MSWICPNMCFQTPYHVSLKRLVQTGDNLCDDSFVMLHVECSHHVKEPSWFFPMPSVVYGIELLTNVVEVTWGVAISRASNGVVLT